MYDCIQPYMHVVRTVFHTTHDITGRRVALHAKHVWFDVINGETIPIIVLDLSRMR